MKELVKGAFELGLPGFLLLIVFIIVYMLISKTFKNSSITADNLANKMDETIKAMHDDNKSIVKEMHENNITLSNKLVETITEQKKISEAINQTMMAVNNSNLRMAVVEEKIDNTNEKVKDIAKQSDLTADKVDEMNIRLQQYTNMKTPQESI